MLSDIVEMCGIRVYVRRHLGLHELCKCIVSIQAQHRPECWTFWHEYCLVLSHAESPEFALSVHAIPPFIHTKI